MLKKFRTYIEPLLNFFPVQLLFNNLKKNQILLLFWVLLFLIITNRFGSPLGIPYLFLDPEYMGYVNYKGLIIIGVALGIYTISFHLTSYILDSKRFPFLGTIKYPFVHFSLNNSIIPSLFIIVYSINFIDFQLIYGVEKLTDIIAQLLAFYAAYTITIILFLLYFRKTNKDTYIGFAEGVDTSLKKRRITAVKVLKSLKNAKKKRYQINSYLSTGLKFKKVDQEYSYDKQALMRVFDQHHLNAAAVEIVVFISIILLGFFGEYVYFQIPAAASGLLLLSFFIMFTGAFSYWLRGWAITGMIVLFLLANTLTKSGWIKTNNEAFGLDYTTEPAVYDLNSISKTYSLEKHNQDYQKTLETLNKWRAKFPDDKKPKMIFLSASGGGQRAAVWTSKMMQLLDSATNGEVMNHSILMTGASGGLIGLAYSRELYLREKHSEKYALENPEYIDKIAQDILNPMIFSMVVNDLFFPFQKFKTDHGHSYNKGRGYAFEKQLSLNTDSILTKKVMDYYEPEKNAEIPIMIMTPTIVNDGRKLYISAQDISYMVKLSPLSRDSLMMMARGIEFKSFFKEQHSENLEMLSALRMSATFPYITPNILLPSEQKMEIMDAGITDNFGIQDATRFAFVFREWIEKNTSGIVFVNIRDTEKYLRMIKSKDKSIMSNLINPIGSVFANWSNIQDFNNDMRMEAIESWFDGNINYVRFEYIPDKESISDRFKKRASLSWHLTQKEKEDIEKSAYKDRNKEALRKLQYLLQN